MVRLAAVAAATFFAASVVRFWTWRKRRAIARAVVVVPLGIALTLAAAAATRGFARNAVPGSVLLSLSTCGGEHRWDVKTLSDQKADLVDFDTVVRTTIHDLRDLPAPTLGRHTPRDVDGKGVELTVYRIVGARLVNARIHDDGDIELIIADKYGRILVTELPNIRCYGAAESAYKREMAEARQAFVRACAVPAWRTLARVSQREEFVGSVSLSGVGFFDLPHLPPRRGGPANNIELHPVLQLAAECARS